MSEEEMESARKKKTQILNCSYTKRLDGTVKIECTVPKGAEAPPQAYNRHELELGVVSEMKRVSNFGVAEILAKQKLDEFPHYYSQLQKFEAELKEREIEKYQFKKAIEAIR